MILLIIIAKRTYCVFVVIIVITIHFIIILSYKITLLCDDIIITYRTMWYDITNDLLKYNNYYSDYFL